MSFPDNVHALGPPSRQVAGKSHKLPGGQVKLAKNLIRGDEGRALVQTQIGALGSKPDADIATYLSVPTTYVRDARLAIGVRAFRPKRKAWREQYDRIYAAIAHGRTDTRIAIAEDIPSTRVRSIRDLINQEADQL